MRYEKLRDCELTTCPICGGSAMFMYERGCRLAYCFKCGVNPLSKAQNPCWNVKDCWECKKRLDDGTLELKECPVCGHVAGHVYQYHDIYSGMKHPDDGKYHVVCDWCGMRTPLMYSRCYVVMLWQTRRDSDNPLIDRDELFDDYVPGKKK